MLEGRYLLSIEELLEKAQVLSIEEWNTYISALCEKLDEERRRKVQAMKLPRKQAESLGAGLLLQYAVQEALEARENGSEEPFVTHLTLAQLLEKVSPPLALSYTYNSHGKPCLQNYPLHFNLSHSGNYIFCAISDREIGADIQSMDDKNGKNLERIVQRFFSEEERQCWENCATEEERKLMFYRLWCRKEAYGKLTGEGVAGVLGKNLMENAESKEEDIPQQLAWEEYNMADQYQIAVCKWNSKRKQKSQ